jgi:hypothetical protein
MVKLVYWFKVSIFVLNMTVMGRRIMIIVMAAVLSGSVSSCKRNPYRISTRGSEVNVQISRLEQDLFTITPGSLQDSLVFLKRKYGNFLNVFSYFVNIGTTADSAWGTRLIGFCTDKQNYEVYGSVMSVFPSLYVIEKELSDAFSHYRHYFSSKPVPSVYTCITGFNYSILTGDSVLGISLDRYLGAECNYYTQLGLYKYQIAKMTPHNVPVDCMYGWGSKEWDYNDIEYAHDNVITSMIHEGKLLYFVKCMLPETDDELIFGFSEAQLRFCRNNEGRMWEYLVENNLLFNSEMLTKKKLTGEAPFTSYFSSESPGRAAVWLGFRIVESYMRRNKDVTLEEMMKDNDVQGLLEKARYHPPAR